MLVSIVYCTKRPGGIDILFGGLKNQKDQDYELIIVDELADTRRDTVSTFADALKLTDKIVFHGKSKKKSYPPRPFGMANALNTGFLEVHGDPVIILTDFVYVEPNLVTHTKEWSSQILTHAIITVAAPQDQIDTRALIDNTATTIFTAPFLGNPIKNDWKILSMVPSSKEMVGWFDLACGSIPKPVLENLNGVDEQLDLGDDCHEINIRDRALLGGTRIGVDMDSYVQAIDHRRFSTESAWTRSPKNTNIPRWNVLYQAIMAGYYPVRPPFNNFCLRCNRKIPCLHESPYIQELSIGSSH